MLVHVIIIFFFVQVNYNNYNNVIAVNYNYCNIFMHET